MACSSGSIARFRRPFSFDSEEARRFSPLVPTRNHDHWLRFLGLPTGTGRTNSADQHHFDAARSPVQGAMHSDSACSLAGCSLLGCCSGFGCVSTVHSSAPQFGRSPREGAPGPCAGHSEHARLLSNIEKLTLPISGSMLPFCPRAQPDSEIWFKSFGHHGLSVGSHQ